jgi:Domain of unknown function (DUF5916)/Carbohydrate family 9 binding domain-like
MKNLSVLGLVLFLCAQAFSQAPSSASTAAGAAVPRGRKMGNVIVPEEKLRPMSIPKLSSGIVIDGRIDEEAWRSAAVFKDFYQVSPGDNIPASKPTEVRMMYDEHNLYIAFKCWDDRDKIRATVAKRDNVFGEDNVRLWLDTYNDQRRAYVLGFNPLGVQQDGIYTEGQGADFSVDIVMESKGVIEDWGWAVEAKVPFKSLRYAAGKGKLWGFNVARNIDRLNDEMDQWLPDDRNVSGFLIKHGKITGLEDVKYERMLEVVPSVTLSETGSRKRTVPNAGFNALGPYDPIFNPIGVRDPGRFVNDPVKPQLSLNLKYTLSPNVTFDAAVNPDFAEIEADAPVVLANQRFPIYFDEKRPFFLEGKDIFETPIRVFYSRTIVDPDAAAKLTGKIGKTTFGFLAASDNAPGNYSQDERGELISCQRARELDSPGNKRNCAIEEFVDKNALFGVLRIKRDFGKENNVGFFATARTFPKNRNFAGGFDGKFKLDPKTILQFQVLGTHSRKFFYDPYTDQVRYRNGNGFGYYFLLDYTADLHGWQFEAKGQTKDYRTDAGFTQRYDSNTFFFANRLSTTSKPTAAIIRTSWAQFVRYGLDWEGRPQQALLGNNFNLNLQGTLSIGTEFGVQFEKVYENEFGAVRNQTIGRQGAFFGAPSRSSYEPYINGYFNKPLSKKIFTYGSASLMLNAIDYDFGAGPRYPRASPAFTSYLQSPEYISYIARLYQYQTDPTHNPYPDFASPPQLDPGKGSQLDLNVGAEYKPIDPFRVSLDYTKSQLTRNDTGKRAFSTNIFSLRSTYQFTRFIFIRSRLDYDTLSANASGQLLLGWNPSPGKAFYVGYNDNVNYNGYNNFTGQFEPGFQRNERSFFIRMSYLFRKSF